MSSSPHLSTHQNHKSLHRGKAGFNHVLHSDGLNNSKLTLGCVLQILSPVGVVVRMYISRRGQEGVPSDDLGPARQSTSGHILLMNHPQHIPSSHLPHFPQKFPLITPNRSKSTLPQNLLVLHPACTPGYSTLASGPFGGCF